jgi:2-C-methyl-D-erythritol 4-phosphate cytidylyltransferase
VSSSPVEKVWTIVVGGGSGARFGGPKQYETLGDRRIIDHSVGAARHGGDGVVIVVPADDCAREGGVAGGATRSESVRAGLAMVPDDATIICVHDAARPFATPALFAAVIAAVRDGADAAIPGVAVADTIKLIDDNGVVINTPRRDRVVAVQTPQAFRADALRAAHASAGEATDDAALVEARGGHVVVVPGEVRNRKITHPDDLIWARAELTR